MNIVIFGLSISSAWGNGHATLLRGLLRELNARGHRVHFFERDVPYYAAHRDAVSFPYADLHLYSNWESVLPEARCLLRDADVGIVTSYCADGSAACDLVLHSNLPRTIFYDMDAPVTLSRLGAGEAVPYLPHYGLGGFDLVLSYTGGAALDQIRALLGARAVATLYGWVDPQIHFPVASDARFECDLSYLGTYAADRHAALESLLISPARALPQHRFLVAGAMYPDVPAWPANIRHSEHIAPPEHCAFYSSSRLTLNVTRATMAALGFCPSGRFFEAAACGTPVLSDWWVGLDTFFKPGEEILLAASPIDARTAISTDANVLAKVGARARERTLDCHTAAIRAERLLDLIESPRSEPAAMNAESAVLEGA